MPAHEGVQPRSRSYSRRGEVGAGKADKGHQRLHARRGLVRASAGGLQALAERQERRDRGSPRRDDRLLGHDPLRRNGLGDPRRQDDSRGSQHRPRLRRDQHRDARALPPDRLRTHAERVFRRRPRDRSRARGPRQGSSLDGRHDVRDEGERPALPRDDRGLLHAHGAQQGRRGDRLRVRQPRQDDRLHQEGPHAERGVGEGEGPLRPVRGRKKGLTPNEAWEKAKGHYGQFEGAAKYIDPRKE